MRIRKVETLQRRFSGRACEGRVPPAGNSAALRFAPFAYAWNVIGNRCDVSYVQDERQMSPVVPWPQADGDAQRVFQTYLNYLEAFRDALRSDFESWPGYCGACLHATRKLQGGVTDEGWPARYLPLAWNTEYLLHRAPLESTDVLRIANHWLPVQAYYAVYCASEAAGFVLDGSAPQSHVQALRTLTAYLMRAISSVDLWCSTSGSRPETGFPIITSTRARKSSFVAGMAHILTNARDFGVDRPESVRSA